MMRTKWPCVGTVGLCGATHRIAAPEAIRAEQPKTAEATRGEFGGGRIRVESSGGAVTAGKA